jgi:hypothetical protein
VLVVREGSQQDLARWGAQDTVLIARKPLSAEQVARFRSVIAEGRFEPIYLPGANIPNPFTELLTSPNPAAFQAGYRYDISPVDDNRPFFFYTVQPQDIRQFLAHASRLSADYNINRAVPLLFGLLLVSGFATAVMLWLPRLALGSRLPREKGVFGFLWYFILIGAGYILIQVALVQKFVLFLGHPTYALTVIIFSMLLSSGIGSFLSDRLIARSEARLQAVLAGVVCLVGLLAVAVTPLLGAGVGLALPVKFAISALLIAPAGLLMGMPFPAGLRRLEARHAASVRWAWSLNAAASVFGSVCSIVFAIYFGLRETVLLGALLYLCALSSVWLTRPPDPAAQPALAGAAARD